MEQRLLELVVELRITKNEVIQRTLFHTVKTCENK